MSSKIDINVFMIFVNFKLPSVSCLMISVISSHIIYSIVCFLIENVS